MLKPDGRGMTLLLGALVAIAPLSMDIYLPSMPSMTRALGATRGRGAAHDLRVHVRLGRGTALRRADLGPLRAPTGVPVGARRVRARLGGVRARTGHRHADRGALRPGAVDGDGRGRAACGGARPARGRAGGTHALDDDAGARHRAGGRADPGGGAARALRLARELRLRHALRRAAVARRALRAAGDAARARPDGARSADHARQLAARARVAALRRLRADDRRRVVGPVRVSRRQRVRVRRRDGRERAGVQPLPGAGEPRRVRRNRVRAPRAAAHRPRTPDRGEARA